MYEEKIAEYKKSKEDLEISLNQNIVNFKMKEDELDTLLMVIEGILVKKIKFNLLKYFYFFNRVKEEINSIIILPDYPQKLNVVLRV
jgi:hypothetical protein